MRKKAFVLIIAMLLVFGLAACVDNTTTTTTTTTGTTATTTTTTTGTTTTTTTGTTTTTTAFSITFTGLEDAGFTPEDVIYVNTWFDLLAGVNANGSDGNNYNDRISLSSYDAACQINAEGQLLSTGAKVCIIQYEVIANMKVARANRTVKISAAPVTIEFTEMPDAIDNTALFGTDYAITDTDNGANTWRYWAENAAVLGTTGFVKVEGGKLMIKQEKIGGVNYALQVISLTNTALVKNQYYKVTMTITSTTDRYIDIVTKAPNNDYANDTHSIIEIKTGTFEYEMVFKANQAVLHFNIMTGAVEGSTDAQAGTLEFSDFTLWQGPIERTYVEVADFFKNDAVAVGAEMEYITGTDTDYVREFYYWDQANGNILAGETLADGFELTILQAATDTWGAQLQWNDINKAGTPLIVDGWYKLEMNINASVARSIEIEIAGRSNSLPVSKKQAYSLNVGDNAIVLEFQSKYDYFFVKMLFGNYGDLVLTGTFVISDMKLSIEEGTEEPVDPVDPGSIIGNVFGTPTNGANTPLGIEGTDIGTEANPVLANTWYLWVGQAAMGWTSYWSEFPELTSNYNAGKVSLDIAKVGAPEFWGIQLKYKGGAIVKDVTYALSFQVYSEVARRIQFEIKNDAFNAVYNAYTVDLVAGINFIEVEFKAADTKLNIQFNLGNFNNDPLVVEDGILEFSTFTLSRPTILVEGMFENGDFATAQAFGAADAAGWAYWTTQGATWLGGNVEYQGTATIADGKLTAVTTQTGHIVWASQIQYNYAGSKKMTVGAVYKVEFDVNASVATTIVAQLVTAGNFANQDVLVPLNQGDNHVSVYFVAQQEAFRFFFLLGNTAPSTLVFDNLTYSEPDVPVVIPNIGNVFGTPTNGANTPLGIEGTDIGTEANPVLPNTWYLWVGQAAMGWTSSWSEFPELTSNYNAGKVSLDITKVGAPEFWGIQLKYKGGAIVKDVTYALSFQVYSEVARRIQFEIKNDAFNAVYNAYTVDLVAGINFVEVEFKAADTKLNIQFNLGNFNNDPLVEEAGLLEFSAFTLSRPTVLVEGQFENGDFATAQAFGAADAAGWAYWTTQGATWLGGNVEYQGTATIADGVLTAITTQTGHIVWASQIQYNHAGTDKMTVGAVYKVEFDVNASVATTIVAQLVTAGNFANQDVLVPLNQGDNHVSVYFVAQQEAFRFFFLLGNTAPSTLVFDNLTYSEPLLPGVVIPEPEVLVNKIDGKGNEVNTNSYWQKNGPSDPFTVTYDGTKAVVVADKPAGAQWSTIKLPVQGDFSIWGSVRIEVQGPAGTQILFKIDPSYEKWVSLTGELQTIVWDLSGIPANVLETVPFIYAFPGAHTNDAFTGTFEIVSFKWIRPVNVYTTADPIVDFDFNQNWVDQWLEGYEVIENPTDVVVNYNRTGGDWTHIRSYVNGNLSDFDYIVLEITGTAGKQIIFKAEGPQGNAEVWFTLTGNKDTVVINISALPAAQVNAFIMVLIFAEPQVGTASGTFTIHKAVFTNTNPAA